MRRQFEPDRGIGNVEHGQEQEEHHPDHDQVERPGVRRRHHQEPHRDRKAGHADRHPRLARADPAAGAVAEMADQRVGDDIEHAARDEHRADHTQSEPEIERIECRQVGQQHQPRHRDRHGQQAVAGELPGAQSTGWLRRCDIRAGAAAFTPGHPSDPPSSCDRVALTCRIRPPASITLLGDTGATGESIPKGHP